MLHERISIRADGSNMYSGTISAAPPRITVRRALGYGLVTVFGLSIGYVLGIVAALLSGLIMLC